tara:strand:+ start:16 stop:366 length:351 start_codon:yes stop_codon:yes gene_type:complete
MSEFEKRMRDLKKDKKSSTTETKGDKLRKNLKEAVSKKTFANPMKMERKKEGFRSKNPSVKFANEMDAMTKGLKTLTSEGPGRVKVGSMAKGGRAMLRGGGICKKGMNKKAVGKNS